ncbi:MAG: polysaccharide deacetylase family protein, partial [Actinomycetes bacterium]
TANQMTVMSHQAYGPLAGVKRILEILERTQVQSTFFVPGYTARRYPTVIKNIVAAGHEIAHHGDMHEQPAAATVEQEIQYIERGIESLQKVAGVTPIGYRAPFWELSWKTPELLVDYGFLYDTSLMDADHPYELAVKDKSLVELPVQWALDDWEQYAFLPDITGVGLIESPLKAREMWQLEFDGLRREGGIFILTNHPFLTGRPSRAFSLEVLIQYALSHSDVWITSLGEIAKHVRSLNLKPRVLTKPEITE